MDAMFALHATFLSLIQVPHTVPQTLPGVPSEFRARHKSYAQPGVSQNKTNPKTQVIRL